MYLCVANGVVENRERAAPTPRVLSVESFVKLQFENSMKL